MKTRKASNIETGKRIRAIRISKGISADDVATLLGYRSMSSISKWETGALAVPKEKRKELAQALDCDVAEIFSNNNEKKVSAVVKVQPVNCSMDGQIWEINSPAGRMQMLVLAESRDIVTGLLLSDDNDGNKTYPIGEKWVDITAIISKPKSYLFNKKADVKADDLSQIKGLICDYLKIEPKTIVQEKIIKEDTEVLQRQIVELKAKLYDLMTM